MMMSHDGWSVPPPNRANYTASFHANDVTRCGYVTGPQARNFMLQFGLQQNTLAQVWNLSDIDKDGRLSQDEFILCMHLIDVARVGHPLPPVLPQDLIPPSYRVRPPVPPMPPMPPAPVSMMSMGHPPIPPAPMMTTMSGMHGMGMQMGHPPIPPMPMMSMMQPQMMQPQIMQPQPVMSMAQPMMQPQQPHDGWNVPYPSRQKYQQMFTQYDNTRVGFISGMTAKSLLMSTGVPPAMLATVWTLSDVDADGNLGLEEFTLSMHLCDLVKAGYGLPPRLTPDLVPPGFRAKLGMAPPAPPPPQMMQQPPMPQMMAPPIPQMMAPPMMPPAPVMQMAPPVPPAPRPPVPPPPAAASVPQSPVVTSPPVTSADGWVIPIPSRNIFTAHFKSLDRESTGYLSGAQGRPVLVQSGLPQTILAQVWNLSDIDRDGRLTCDEFILCSYLIEQAKLGISLPQTLTPELVPPSYRRRESVTALPQTTPTPSQPASRTGSVSEVAPSSSEPPPPAGVMLTEWAVPQPSKLKYVQTFNSHDRNRSGFISGVQARGVLVQSGLPQDALAKIWSLCDVTLSGKLSCEEFVLAMHLIDIAKAGDTIPTVLPPDLIPPSHRRRRNSSVSSGGVPAADASTTSAANDSTASAASDSLNKNSFEDKRKENFERGQAVLDRKRQVLADAQRRELEEQERKDRVEEAKREKVRQEMERRRQEEVDKQIAKQKEIEAEREEVKRKQLEQREAARREMERQRMAEWEGARIQELHQQKDRVMEQLGHVRSKKKMQVIEVETVTTTYEEKKALLEQAKERVKVGKGDIDAMRIERDTKMKGMHELQAKKKTNVEKDTYLKRERDRITKLFKESMGVESLEPGSDSAKLALDNRQALLDSIKTQITEVEEEKEVKKGENDKHADELAEVQKSLDQIKSRVKELQATYRGKMQEGKQAKEKILEKQQNFDPNAEWDSPAPASELVGQSAHFIMDGPTTPYKVAFPFEARNEDELNINTGDIVLVTPNPGAEEGWFQGQLDGKVGWFPESYVEPMDSSESGGDTGKGDQPAVNGDGGRSNSIPQVIPASTLSNIELKSVTQVGEDEVVAIYPWSGQNSDQLSFTKNDVIKVTDKQGDWWFGSLKGKTGWFPQTYVNDKDGVDAIEEWFVTLFPFESQEEGDLAFEAGEVVQVVKKEGEWWTGQIGADRNGVFPSNYVRDAEVSEIPKPNGVQEPSSDCPSSGKTEGDSLAPGVSSSGATTPVKGSKSPMVKRKSSLRRGSRESMSDSPGKPKPKGKGKKPEIVIVVAAFSASGPEQLNLEKGQLVQVRKKNESGWWEGEIQVKGKGKEVGWFPATYVKSLAPVKSASDMVVKAVTGPPPSNGSDEVEKVIAIYPFKAQHDDEMSFEANEVIKIVSKDDPTWWKGIMTSTGQTGLFPSNHVTVYEGGLQG